MGSPKRILGAVLTLTLSAAACSASHAPGPPSGGYKPDDLVLQVRTVGGFIAPSAILARIPTFSLYGDGRVITEGPMIAIYPPPALPNLLVQTISGSDISAIVKEAAAAGLNGPDETYLNGPPDVGTTRFSLLLDGKFHQISVTGLGGPPAPGSSPANPQIRDLQNLMDKLTSLGSWLPKGSVGSQRAYAPTAMAVLAGAHTGAGGEPLPQKTVAWPLTQQPLNTFATVAAGSICGTVAGADLPTLIAVAQRTNTLTPWSDGGKLYTLTFRLLLPSETGCASLAG